MFFELHWVDFPKVPEGLPRMGHLGFCLSLDQGSFSLISFLVDFIVVGKKEEFQK